MKKFLCLILLLILAFSLSSGAIAGPSLSLDYLNGQLDVENSEGRKYDPSNKGFALEIEYPVGRFIFNLGYTILNNPEDYDSNSGYTLYEAEQSVMDAKVGYRIINNDQVKFDANLVYNELEYDVTTNTYQHKIKNTFIELKSRVLFSGRISTDLYIGLPISSSTTDSNEATITDSKANYYGMKLNYSLNEHWFGVLGYRVYENEFTRDSVTRQYKQNGFSLGIKYNF